MKKILLLLFAAWKLSAGSMDDLEKGIMKSDLAAVQKLITSNISISGDEKIALINLATEIIKKREDKIFINSVPTYCKKYLTTNHQLDRYQNLGVIFALSAVIVPVISLIPPAVCEAAGCSGVTVLRNSFISGVTGCFLCLFASVYNVWKYNALVRKLIINHNDRYSVRRDNAIQIRQLLYKIKAQSI